MDYSTNSDTTILVDNNKTLVAHFAPNPIPIYDVHLSSSPLNAGVLSGAGSYDSGSVVTISATPSSGFSFVNWSENGNIISTNSTVNFTLLTNRTLVANFEQLPTPKYDVILSINPTGAGSVNGNGNFDSGSVVTISASSNSGYTFKN